MLKRILVVTDRVLALRVLLLQLVLILVSGTKLTDNGTTGSPWRGSLE